MTSSPKFFAKFASAAVLAGALGAEALAELPQPNVRAQDDISVDMISGQMLLTLPGLSIGDASMGLEHELRLKAGAVYLNNDNYFNLGLNGPGDNDTIDCWNTWEYQLGQTSVFFCRYGNAFVPYDSTGGELFVAGYNSSETFYRDSEGVEYRGGYNNFEIRRPNGLITTITEANGERFVSQNNGLRLRYSTQMNGSAGTLTVTGVNAASEYCNDTGTSCSTALAWPTATYSSVVTCDPNSIGVCETVLTVTDQGAQVTTYRRDVTYGTDNIATVSYPPNNGVETITWELCPSNPAICGSYSVDPGARPGVDSVVYPDIVRGAIRDGRQWTYYFNSEGPFGPGGIGFYSQEYRSTAPNGLETQISRLLTQGGRTMVAGLTLADGRDVSYESSGVVINETHNYFNRLAYIDSADGSSRTSYGYDLRGNMTEIRRIDNSGELPDEVRTADYPASCTTANRLYCNKPTWIRDPRGNQTDYTYDGTHGGVLSVTGPAVDGVRPQTRYSYEQIYARVRTSGGGYANESSPIWMMTRESFCRNSAWTGSACAGGDEVVTEYDYGQGTSGGNNLFLRGVAVTADGETRRTCHRYDRFGNRISSTEPQAGLASCS